MTEATSRTLTIEAAAKQLGIGRSLAYDLARRGELPGVLKLGSRYLVSRAALDKTLGTDMIHDFPPVEISEHPWKAEGLVEL